MNSKSVAIAALLLLACACEGEPPKMPEGPAVPHAAEPAAAAPAEEAEPAVAVAPTPAALPPCACCCNVAAAADGGSPDGGAPAAVVAAVAPAATRGTISGALTTTPKASAANAIVYLEGAPIEPTAKMTASITNKMMTFSPFVAVVPAGGKVTFRNDDPFPHNVFSPDNERFNMGMIPQRTAAVRVFKSAGAYTLLCNVHPGMVGYLVVAPSSYFAKADAQGHYAIKNVPPGTYKLTAWAPRQKPVTQPVTVKDGDVSVDFELHR